MLEKKCRYCVNLCPNEEPWHECTEIVMCYRGEEKLSLNDCCSKFEWCDELLKIIEIDKVI